jgi:ADP-ribose pyrophosphatase
MDTAPSRSPYDYSTGVPALQAVEARMILIAGADLCQMEAAASVIFDAGHVPVIAPWFTEPLVALSAFDAGTEESVDQILQPLTDRLIARCDAILRVGGASAAADAMAGAGRARGLRVFHDVKEALDG